MTASVRSAQAARTLEAIQHAQTAQRAAATAGEAAERAQQAAAAAAQAAAAGDASAAGGQAQAAAQHAAAAQQAAATAQQAQAAAQALAGPAAAQTGPTGSDAGPLPQRTPGTAGSAAQAAGSAAAGGQTRGERVEQLQQTFGSSLGRFDQRLGREQGTLEALSAQQAQAFAQGGGLAGEHGEGAAAGAGYGGGSNPGNATEPLTQAGAGYGQQPPQSGTYQRGAATGTRADLPHDAPTDVGTGNDDDVIARQLREAAQSEADPALREKLWAEYRAYKRGG